MELTPTSARKAPVQPFPDLGLLYRNDEHWLNEFWFLGRYHGQNHWAEGSTGEEDEGWEHRAVRVGVQMRLFQRLTLHAQALAGPNLDPIYGGFTELWASWKFLDSLNLTVGQQKHRFTHDRTVSRRYLNYIERSMLTNMFGLEYTPAVTLSGRLGRWSYYTGIFSNATGREIGEAFTRFDSGYSFLASLTLDLHGLLPTDSAQLNLSYLGSDARPTATLLRHFEDGLSAALILTDGPASLVTELTGGIGADDGDAIGLNLQPGVFLTDRLQLVGRYQVAESDGKHGLHAQPRYERDVGLTTGDFYQAGYVGLNYHFAGHRAKLLTGAEYAMLGGEDAWTAFAAIRVFWGPHAGGPFPIGPTLPGIW
jgi:hypothetical protein